MNEQEFIDQLAGDLKPVKRASPPMRSFWIWSVCNFSFLLVAITFSGNLREGWHLDLLHNFRFLLEVVAGVGVSTISGFFLFKHALPDEEQTDDRNRWTPLIILFLFSALLVIGVFLPAKMPSELGARHTCVWQMLGFSIPPLLILLYHLGKSAPVNLIYVGFLAGLAASAPFATAMHLACMYDPKHILVWHIFPMIVFSLLASIVAKVFVKWWK